MRILLDGRPCRGSTGIGRYARSVVEALPSRDRDRAYSILSWRREARALRQISGGTRVVALPPGRVFTLFERLGVPQPWLGAFRIFHGTSFSVPRLARMRTIGTFYDIAYRRFPEAYPPGVALGFDRSVRRALVHVDRVVTLSNHAKAEIVDAYGVDEGRVDVIYPAAIDPQSTGGRQRSAEIAEPYLLFVGEIGPRKNVVNLVRAFARAAESIPHRLVIAGPPGPLPAYVQRVRSEVAELGLAARVTLTGWVTDETLHRFYREAEAVLLPSFYEGFGYPLIDAMAFGKPLVTSSTSSMPEVAGDAALLVDPHNLDEIAAALVTVGRDRAVRLQLSTAGRRRASRFTSEAMVSAFSALYRSLADGAS